MIPSITQFNVSYQFDKHLREIPNEPQDMETAVRVLKSKASQEQDLVEKMHLWGQIGRYSRILCHLDQAHYFINQALAAANTLRDQRTQFINLLQMAHVYQWQGDFKTATSILDRTVFICELAQDIPNHPLKDCLDYAYYQIGVCKFDQEQFNEAGGHFQRALALREQKRRPELIAQTRLALKAVHNKLMQTL